MPSSSWDITLTPYWIMWEHQLACGCCVTSTPSSFSDSLSRLPPLQDELSTKLDFSLTFFILGYPYPPRFSLQINKCNYNLLNTSNLSCLPIFYDAYHSVKMYINNLKAARNFYTTLTASVCENDYLLLVKLSVFLVMSARLPLQRIYRFS